jgi:dTMP kinase
MSRPPYIALEGAEGSGKSTQAALLAATIGALLTRETGGTAIGRRLRDVLHDNAVVALDFRAEALIAAADRAQHVSEIVIPALDAGTPVVSDRSVYSTLAYQGYGRGLGLRELRFINSWAAREIWPDLVVLIEVPPEVVAERLRARQLDRFERAGPEFHERVLAGYRQMAVDEPGRWIVIRSAGSPEHVASQILAAVRDRYPALVAP